MEAMCDVFIVLLPVHPRLVELFSGVFRFARLRWHNSNPSCTIYLATEHKQCTEL